MHSNEVKVYEVIYAIGEKVYKEKNFVIPVESDFYFGEIEASGCIENFLCTLGLFCASGLFTGAFISGLVIGSSELTAVTGIGGTISYIGYTLYDNGNHCKAAIKIITAQPMLQNLPVDCETIIIKIEEYNRKQSFVKFLEDLEKSKNFKISDIIKRSRLVIEIPNTAIDKDIKQDTSLYKEYQVDSLFKKYRNAYDRFVLQIFFSVVYQKKYSSGYVEYININNEALKYITGEQYQAEELNIRKNYVVIEGDMVLTGRWVSSTIHEGKKNKIINKEEKISLVVSANGDVKIEDKYLKVYQENKINIDYGANDLFIGGVPFALAVTCGKWKNTVPIILEKPTSTVQQASANIIVAGIHGTESVH